MLQQAKMGRYISLTPGPWTALMDLVHGLLEWTTHGLPWMDRPEVCGRHGFNEAGTRTKDAINQQTQFWNTSTNYEQI